MMKFKKVILCSTFLVGINSMEVQANDFVDWTPVLKSLENACGYSKSLESIGNSLKKFDEKKNSFEIKPDAKRGIYKGIDAKYQRVMRPAFVNVSGEYKNFRIPLVNSKLYGLEIVELNFYKCNQACGINGMDITFKPMNLQNYNKLKSRKYFKDDTVDFGVRISDFKAGKEIILDCDQSM